MSAATLQNFSTANLPANGVWSKGTAPAERWKELADDADSLRTASLEAMEKQGNASIETLEGVRKAFEQFGRALQESMPVHQSLPLLCGDWSNFAWYYAGSRNGELLFKYSNPMLGSNRYRDKLGSKVKDLVGGYKKIERKVIGSLREEGPASKQSAGFLGLKNASQAVEELFSKQADALNHVAALAATVKRDGVYVRSKENYG